MPALPLPPFPHKDFQQLPPVALDWLRRLYNYIAELVDLVPWDSVNKAGSDLRDIETRNHNDLENIQGGTSAERWHLTEDEYDDLIALLTVAAEPQWLQFAIGDETTALTTGTAKLTTRLPACTVLSVRASLTTSSSSGNPTFDINEAGTTILSTKLSIDSGEKTSTTAATAAVISDATIADDAEITFDIDTAGTGAAGAKISMQVRWT
jgi:hypothetical protein